MSSSFARTAARSTGLVVLTGDDHDDVVDRLPLDHGGGSNAIAYPYHSPG